MSNMTPFEIRLELLKMAKDMLVEDYFGKREAISNEWKIQRLIAKSPPDNGMGRCVHTHLSSTIKEI